MSEDITNDENFFGGVRVVCHPERISCIQEILVSWDWQEVKPVETLSGLVLVRMTDAFDEVCHAIFRIA